MAKIRYVDFNPADLIANTAGELTLDEFSVYWMICTLIYLRRDRVDELTRRPAQRWRRLDQELKRHYCIA